MADPTASDSKMDMPVKLLKVLEGHQGAVYDLCTDGQGRLLSAGGDGWVVRWERNAEGWVSDGRAVAKLASPVYALVSLSGNVKAGTGGGEVVEIRSDGQWSSEQVHNGAVCCLTARGSGGVDGRWVSSEMTSSDAAFPGRIRCALHLQGDDLFGTSEGCIHSRSLGWQVNAHEGPVRAMMTWPGKNALASVGGDGRMRVWQAADQGLVPLVSLDAHKGSVYRLASSPDGRIVATCSRDRSMALWSARDLSLVARVGRPSHPGHVRSINALCWLSDHMVATAGDDGRILIWALGEEGGSLGDYF